MEITKQEHSIKARVREALAAMECCSRCGLISELLACVDVNTYLCAPCLGIRYWRRVMH